MRALFKVRLPALALALSAIVLVAACGDDDNGNNPNPVNAEDVLAALPDNVIMPTYEDLVTQAGAFTAAIAAFNAAPTDPNLTAARQAWRDVRTPWESGEAFGFGPADVGGFDEQSDSWPVNTTDIENLLAGATTLDKAGIDALADPGTKGYHAIEYVLFGAIGGNKLAADFTARELEYLVGASQALEGQLNGLHDAWDAAGGDYSGELANAGNGSGTYATQEDALAELISGMADIADELANSKMAGALGPPVAHDLEESAFSSNSTADFQHNLAGVSNIYLGQYGASSGLGISDLVKEKNATVDANVRAYLTAAQTAIAALQPTFSDALDNNPTLVQDAIDAVNLVHDIIDQDVRQLLVP